MKMTKKNVKNLITISLLASILSVLSPFTINVFIIPFSISTLLIMLYAVSFDLFISEMSVIIYILLGLVGLPVFSNGVGGINKLMSPTGGFIIGYIFLNLFIGLFYNKKENAFYHYLILLFGNAILYIIGSIWFMIVTNNSLYVSLMTCVVPFIISDHIKIFIVILITPKIKRILEKNS